MSGVGKHTPGPWEMDSINNDGEYGLGPNARSGFKSFAVFDSKGNILFDSLNRDSAVSEIHESDTDAEALAWDEPAKNDIRLAAAAPDLLAACRRAVEYAPNEVEAQILMAAIAKATPA